MYQDFFSVLRGATYESHFIIKLWSHNNLKYNFLNHLIILYLYNCLKVIISNLADNCKIIKKISNLNLLCDDSDLYGSIISFETAILLTDQSFMVIQACLLKTRKFIFSCYGYRCMTLHFYFQERYTWFIITTQFDL